MHVWIVLVYLELKIFRTALTMLQFYLMGIYMFVGWIIIMIGLQLWDLYCSFPVLIVTNQIVSHNFDFR